MLANYGYKNGSFGYSITMDPGRCDASGRCAKCCSTDVFIVLDEDVGAVIVTGGAMF